MKEHGKEGRLCSGIHRYYQKWDFTSRNSNQTAEMIAIKGDSHEKRKKMGNKNILSELYVVHLIQ